MKPNIYIIGCGGGGSWITPAIINLASRGQVTIVDGDRLERKNLDRQLFDEGQIGENKAATTAMCQGCKYHEGWFSQGVFRFEEHDWLIVCVDNMIARKDALAECDRYGCSAVFCANETWSAEAYVYRPEWKDTKADPRIYIPEILTDKSGDPRSAAIGCTGEAQEQTRQLVSANMMSAALGAHLFALWHLQAKKLSKDARNSLPYRRMVTMTGAETYTLRDLERTAACQD